MLSIPVVRVLEARFHSQQDPQDFIVVGHLVWDDATEGQRPVVQPSLSLLVEAGPATVLSKLQYLVSLTSPDSFTRLQALRSQFWSFVEVIPDAAPAAGMVR